MVSWDGGASSLDQYGGDNDELYNRTLMSTCGAWCELCDKPHDPTTWMKHYLVAYLPLIQQTTASNPIRIIQAQREERNYIS